MGIFRNAKRGLMIGGLVGALAGSQYGSVREAYEDVLEADIKQKEAVLDYVKDNRKKYLDRETYRAALDEIREDYTEAKEKLNHYEDLDEKEKKKEALTDVNNYGLTIQEMEFGLPDSKERIKGSAKGGMYGAGTGVVLLTALGIRSGLKKRKKRIAEKKSLEGRLSIFLSLIAGGIGVSMVFSNFSGVVTGNVIRNAGYSSSGILGIFLLVGGFVGTYFYFKN